MSRQEPNGGPAPPRCLRAAWDRATLRPAQAVLSADEGTPNPIGQDTPVEWFGQYPPGFFARYCWW